MLQSSVHRPTWYSRSSTHKDQNEHCYQGSDNYKTEDQWSMSSVKRQMHSINVPPEYSLPSVVKLPMTFALLQKLETALYSWGIGTDVTCQWLPLVIIDKWICPNPPASAVSRFWSMNTPSHTEIFKVTFALCPSALSPFLTASTSIL